MRCTQYIGLNDRAQELIQGLISFHTHSTVGMFNEEVPLYSYKNANGEVVYIEEEQAVIWSSGPMIFTALKRNKKGGFVVKSLWTDKEIEGYY